MIKNENKKETVETPVAPRMGVRQFTVRLADWCTICHIEAHAIVPWKEIRSRGVNCSDSSCHFASPIDSSSIGGLLLSSRSRKLSMMSSFGGLQLNTSVEEFFVGLIILLEDI